MRNFRKYDNFFADIARKFMLENGFKQVGPFFEKQSEDLFEKVYLCCEVDKYEGTISIDIIHIVRPLMLEFLYEYLDDKDADDFSLSELSGQNFIVDIRNKEEIPRLISQCYSLYKEKYKDYFDISTIEDYVNKYIYYEKITSIGKMRMHENEDPEMYEYGFFDVFFYLNRYEECVKQLNYHIRVRKDYLVEFYNNKINEDNQRYFDEVDCLCEYRDALLNHNYEFIEAKRKEMFKIIEKNKDSIQRHYSKNNAT